MPDSKYFGIPFATSGDKATIPETVQPSGVVSFTQGFGPDYERDPATDPLAKRVPRDETNELYYQLTNSVRFLQLYGTPEWYAADDVGDPVAYPVSARVRYDAGSGMQIWASLVAANTATPGSDPAKWTLVEPYSIAALEASLTEALAAAIGTKIITPRRLGSAVQRGVWNYAAAAGTANAVTVTLTPAPANLAALVGSTVRVKFAALNTGAMTINVNGFGAVAITRADAVALSGGEVGTGQIWDLFYDGTQFQLAGVSSLAAKPVNSQSFTASGIFNVPAGVSIVRVAVRGAGGGGGGATAAASAGGGGGGAEYRAGWVPVTPGDTVIVTIGEGGLGGVTDGNPGGHSTFGGLITANGGAGGTGGGGAGGGGNGGTGGSGGTESFGGSTGETAYILGSIAQSGQGGAAFGLTGAFGVSSTSAGIPGRDGPQSGSGGGGGVNGGPGGKGNGGRVDIEWG